MAHVVGQRNGNVIKPVTRNKSEGVSSYRSLLGGDGDFTVSALNTVLNEYAILAADASALSTSFSVTDITDLDSPLPQLGTLAPGDLLMLIQMQGASIDTSDTVNYGDITNLNGAGSYEFVFVQSIVGNTITIDSTTCLVGLRNAYTTIGRTQVVRVPRFDTLTIDSGASVVPVPWNGSTGGVVALNTSNQLILNGAINATAQGFRGGVVEQDSINGSIVYRSGASGAGAEKGEGIAGSAADYDFLEGRFGRGSPANGGGGGNNHNAGGGGGANGDNGNLWNGQGVMSLTNNAAWSLDPGYVANGNALTTSSGGGRGGYTYSSEDLDATVIGPNNFAWGSYDGRREVGGLGGRPLSNNPASRMFLGGGGGAGDSNDSNGTSGANGGGIVHIITPALTGTGTIESNGGDALDTINNFNDGPGGGGGGGTVIVYSIGSVDSITISADGGDGGSQPITVIEAEGPGGGGGGGYVAIRSGTAIMSANGGAGGITTSTGLSEFPENGATNGGSGQTIVGIPSVPLCTGPTAASVSIEGRVKTAFGKGISRAHVAFLDSSGNSTHAVTNSFGYFRLDGLTAGESGTLTVGHKRYFFETNSAFITPVDAVTTIDFIAAD